MIDGAVNIIKFESQRVEIYAPNIPIDGAHFTFFKISSNFFLPPHFSYSKIHPYLSLVVCVFGCIANILNIVVLTRPEMRSPTNAILTGLAIADFCVMIDYIPFALYMGSIGVGSKPYDKFTNSWSLYILLHAFISQNLHTISIFLTVILAIWRYIAVGFPQKNRVWCDMNNTLVAIVGSYVLTPIMTIPIYFVAERVAFNKLIFVNGSAVPATIVVTPEFISENHIENATLYVVSVSQLARDHPSLSQFTFLIYSGNSRPFCRLQNEFKLF